MREIKFRAYHKVRKEMYNVHGWHSEYVFKDTLDGVGCEGNPDKLEDVELMQYTGLKDMNGSEIYIDDIIKTKHGSIKIINDLENFHIWIYQNTMSFLGIEIIGNIHEHKHLIS